MHRRALDLAPDDVDDAALARRRLRARRSGRRAAPPPQARPRAAAAGEGRPRVRRAHRAEPAARRRGLRAPVRGVPQAARSARRRVATAARCVDLQVTTVFPNGLASRFHQIVFQPLTDAAAAEAREYGFSFEADTETVQLRGAKVYRKTARSTRPSRAARAPTDDPAMAMYSSARAFYVHFPRLDPGDVVELRYRVEDVTARNAFADYFGEVVYMQSTEPIAALGVRADHAEVATVLLQQAERRRPGAEGRGEGRHEDLALHRRERRAARDRADDAARHRDARPRARVDLQELGRHGPLVLGPRARSVHRRRRGPPSRRRDHEGPHRRQGQDPRRLRLRGAEDALRRARVRHPRLQAVSLRADLRARVRRLQRQGDAHRHDAEGARASRPRS